MAEYQLEPERLEAIRERAYTLFMHQHTVHRHTRDGRQHMVSPDPQRMERILDMISDSGLIYMNTWEELSSLWTRIRSHDDLNLANWLLQSASDFRASAFVGDAEYLAYLNNLASAYTLHHDGVDDGSKQSIIGHVAIDDEIHDRMPRRQDFLAILRANAWLVYLISLHLNYDRLLQTLYSQNYHWQSAVEHNSEIGSES